MSQKIEKPTLQGQRIKTRKRDEKEKYDPAGFRDAVLQGLHDAGSDLEAVYKFLDSAGDRLDYRRYGEALFDSLIVGGILAPGGSVITDNADPSKITKTQFCLFGKENEEDIKNFAQVFTRLMRRYKYLERMFEDEMNKVLAFLKGFKEEDRLKLATAVAYWINNNTLPPAVLNKLLQDHLVKEGIALDFIIKVFCTWKTLDKDIAGQKQTLKKAGLDNKLLEFFPHNKRSAENFHSLFKENGLTEIVEFQKAQKNAEVKRELQKELDHMIKDSENVKEIIDHVCEKKNTYALEEKDIIVIIWCACMGSVEWNKKEELVADQALKHLKTISPLFAAFTTSDKAELVLLLKIQEFCYDNMNFMKVFQKIVFLFYKTDVLSEDTVLKWYHEAHLTKGKSVFLDQMKKFVVWLENAEEESEEED